MNEYNIKHHFSAGVYIRQQSLEAGKCVETHQHNFDHFGLLGKGSAIVEVESKGSTYDGPCVIEIKAGKKHKITALSNIDWFCIHHVSAEDATVEKIDAALIKE